MDREYAQKLLKKTIQDYNLIAEEFSSKRKYPWPELKFLFEDYLITDDKVLDLGCGNGRFFEFCQNKRVRYFGIDSSEKLIRMAKKKYPDADFRVANALNLPFSDNYFDKIYSIALLHHIPSKELRHETLIEAKRVLKPGGRIFLSVWNLNFQKKQSDVLKQNILKIFGKSKLDFNDVFVPWGRVTRYVHYFSKKELECSVKKAGFETEMVKIIKRAQGEESNICLIAKKPRKTCL